MSEKEVKELKNKVKQLQSQISQRTRNYMFRNKTQHYASHLNACTQTQTDDYHPKPTQQHTNQDEELVQEQEKLNNEEQESTYNANTQMKEYIVYLERQNKLLSERIEEYGMQVIELKQKYSGQQNMKELQHILKYTSAIQQLQSYKIKEHHTFKQYQQLRIREYQLNQQINKIIKEHALQIQSISKEINLLLCQLKICREEKADYQLAYLQLKEYNTKLLQTQPININTISQLLFDAMNELPILNPNILFKPQTHQEIVSLLKGLSEFAHEYQTNSQSSKLKHRKQLQTISKLLKIIYFNESKEQVKRIHELQPVQAFFCENQTLNFKLQKLTNYLQPLFVEKS